MALSVTHSKVSVIADDPTASGAGEVLPSDWNAAHVVTGAASVISVLDFGAVGDGVTNDTAAIQAAINAAFGTSGSPHGTNTSLNSPLYFPPGNYKITSPLTMRSVRGGRIYGAGRFTTTITQATSGQSVFVTNGFEYSSVEGLYLTCSGAGSKAFNLDWDNTGTTALQSNTFKDMFFQGDYGLAIGFTGYMGSETLILNCAFANCTTAGISTGNFNAVQQTVVGGNIQNCGVGILVGAGSVPTIIGVGFQLSGTYDIQVNNSANDTLYISGCRTESLNFLNVNTSLACCVYNCGQTNSTIGIFAQCQSGAIMTIDGCNTVGGNIANNRIGYWVIRNSSFGRGTDWLKVNDPANPPLGGYILVQNVQYGGTTNSSVPTTYSLNQVFVQNQWLGAGSTTSAYLTHPVAPASTTEVHQLGNVDAAAPNIQVLRVQSVVAGTSNTAGVDWTLQGSLSTGSGAPGKLIISGGSNTNPGATTQRAAATIGVFHFPNAHPLMGLGGSSSSFGGIRGRGAVVEAVLADDSAYASFQCNDLIATGGALTTNNGTVYLSNDSAGAARIQFGTAGDIELARISSTLLRVGAPDSGSPTALTLQAQSAVGSNIAGINWTHNGSLSTGSGTSGDLIFQTGGTGAGATSQNAAVEALRIKGATQQVIMAVKPRINVAPTAVGTGTKTISNGADSSTNFGHYVAINMNGTDYFFPCSSVAPT